MVPSAMEELFPDLDPSDWPVYQEVDEGRRLPPDQEAGDAAEADAAQLPEPRQLRHLGRRSSSRFLAEKAEEAGAYILTETAADKLLVEDRIVRGIRSGDKGRGRDGEELGNFEPGSDVMAKATVLAEGTLGHLTSPRSTTSTCAGDPQRWEIGVKEVWKVPKPLDRVIHTMNWPLRGPPEVERVRRQLHLPDGRGQGLHRHGRRARHHRRDLLLPRRAAAAEDPPLRHARCSTAASGSPGARRRSPPAATGRCRSGSRCPAW